MEKPSKRFPFPAYLTEKIFQRAHRQGLAEAPEAGDECNCILVLTPFSDEFCLIDIKELSLNQLPIILMSDAYRPDRHAAPPVSGIAFAEAKNEYNIAKGKNLSILSFVHTCISPLWICPSLYYGSIFEPFSQSVSEIKLCLNLSKILNGFLCHTLIQEISIIEIRIIF